MEKQRTLKESAAYSGITLHTGVRASLVINPAPENTGIVFRRVDLPTKPSVRALASNVVDVRRGTKIAADGAEVYTVEHVMASLHASGVDNAIVDMDGPEPPILDGSAKIYFEGILKAGLREQSAEARFYTPAAPLYVDGGDTQMVIAPNNGDKLTVHCTASFRSCPFDPQFFATDITLETFQNEIAPARTFVDYNELKMLFSIGLCRGGSLDNAAILHNGAIICKDRTLWKNEIVRHKILDLIGDLYLTGVRMRGNVIAIRPGHPTNVKTAGEILKTMQKQ